MKIIMSGKIREMVPAFPGTPSDEIKVMLSASDDGAVPDRHVATVSLRIPKKEAEELKYGQELHVIVSTEKFSVEKLG
jgi:hypothetical protein